MENGKKLVIDFGDRKLYNHQFTTVISLPRQALKNCTSSRFEKINVRLILEDGEKYLKLTPVLELKKVIN